MGEQVTIRLAGVPQAKGRPRFVRATGHAFTPQATRSYEAALRYAAQEQMAGKPPLEGQLSVTVIANFPIPKSFSKGKRCLAQVGDIRPITKPDVDNLLKSLDALNGVVFGDDKQIVQADVRKFYSDRPELAVMVRTLG